MATQTPSRTSSPHPEVKGLRSAFRRWKDKWRTQSPSHAYKPNVGAPCTDTSAAPPMPPLHSVPASPVPLHAALFTPTTQTTIHSPADPRNRSASPSPANTLRKTQRPVLSRRNTIQAEYLASTPNPRLEDYSNIPLNLVTTTIVAGNGNVNENPRQKRQSRLRLSFSKRGSAVPSPLGSPSLPRFTERSSGRATGRFEAVPEGELGRRRADSYREGLMEEAEVVRKDRMKGVEGASSGRGTPVPGAVS